MYEQFLVPDPECVYDVEYKDSDIRCCNQCYRYLDVECFKYANAVCQDCKGWYDHIEIDGLVCGLCDIWKPKVAFHIDNYVNVQIRSQCKRCVKRRNTRTPELAQGLRDRTALWTSEKNDSGQWIYTSHSTKPRKGKPATHTRRTQMNICDLRGDYMTHLIMYYGYKCMNPKCEKPLSEKNPISHDHVIPLTWGGTNEYRNSQLLCKSCNSAKRNYNDNDYRTIPILTIEVLDVFLLQYSISYTISGDYLVTGENCFS